MSNSSKTKSSIQSLDIFSYPFQFNIDTDQKQKKTFIGGLMSVSVLALSFAYLVYLCLLYFNNQIQPSVGISNVNESSPYQMKIVDNLISTTVILPNGQDIYSYQKSQGKVYLQILSALNVNGTKNKITFVPLIPCSDQTLKGYLCLDTKSLRGNNQEFDLAYNPMNSLLNNIHIMLIYCQDQFLESGQVCASPQETNELLLNYSTLVQIRTSMTQYNLKTSQYENRIKQESFFFDTNLVFYTRFSLLKYDVAINEGFIIQKTSSNTFFGDYIRADSYSSLSFVENQMGMSILGAVYYCISQESTNVVYQFPPFTSVFAQFTSIFNTLLYIGYFCKIFAIAEIFHQVIELQLKTYYLKTRLFLLEFYGDKQELNKAKKEGAFSLWKYAQTIDIKDRICKNLNVNIFMRMKLIFFGADKQSKPSDSKCNEKLILASLHDISDKAINVFNLQKEILEIKMMLKLILSVEQYAAIKLCGCRVPNLIDQCRSLKLRRNSIFNEALLQQNLMTHRNTMEIEQIQLSSDIKIPVEQFQQQQQKMDTKIDTQYNDENFELNHLEQIDLMERDQEYFKSCIDKYLANSQRDTEIDKRIADCMIGITHPENDCKELLI